LLVGGLAGPFEVLRFELNFDDGSTLRTIAPGAPLRAEATVSYSGTGELRAVWELADAGSTAGTPIFRPLRNVLRYLGASGRVRLQSPELPTAGSGLHLFRLRVVEPDTAFPLPTIRYFVMEEAGRGQAPQPLQLRGPGHLASLGDDTRFAWDLVEGASAYQIEIYAKPDPKAAAQPRPPANPSRVVWSPARSFPPKRGTRNSPQPSARGSRRATAICGACGRWPQTGTWSGRARCGSSPYRSAPDRHRLKCSVAP
jgi:hypothetical protein